MSPNNRARVVDHSCSLKGSIDKSARSNSKIHLKEKKKATSKIRKVEINPQIVLERELQELSKKVDKKVQNFKKKITHQLKQASG